MTIDSKSHARAAVLAGTLSMAPLPPSILELRVAGIHMHLDVHTPSLDVPRFHYRIMRDGSLIALHHPWRRCPHRRHR